MNINFEYRVLTSNPRALAGLTNNFRGETARKFVVVSLSLFNRATIVIYKLNW